MITAADYAPKIEGFQLRTESRWIEHPTYALNGS